MVETNQESLPLTVVGTLWWGLRIQTDGLTGRWHDAMLFFQVRQPPVVFDS